MVHVYSYTPVISEVHFQNFITVSLKFTVILESKNRNREKSNKQY